MPSAYWTVRHNVADGDKARWKADFAAKNADRTSHAIAGSDITKEGPGFIEVTHRVENTGRALGHVDTFDNSGTRKMMGAVNKPPKTP